MLHAKCKHGVTNRVLYIYIVQKHFGDEVMDYTVVVLTHADATFRDSSLSEYIASLPEVKPKDAETPSEGAISATDSNIQSISMRKFLRDDVGEHVIAVNNKYRCEYERLKQRDALIDLIDVVQTKNNAKCFKNK